MEDLKDKVATAHRIMHQQGLADYLGHVSARIPGEDKFYIKGIIISLQTTTRADIVTCDLDGKFIEGNGKPPAESVLHGEILKARKDVGAVVHSHQKWATAFGITGKRILPISHPGFSSLVEDPIPIYENADLIINNKQARDVAKALGKGPICHLRNHGIVVVGADVEEAIFRTVNLERLAELNFIAMQMGTPKAIPQAVLDNYKQWELDMLKTKKVSIPQSAWVYYRSLVPLPKK